MQTETEDAWENVATYTAVTSSNTAELMNVTNFLRYVRFNVTGLSGTSPIATFTLQGMARRWA